MRQSAYKCCIPGPLDYVSADEFPWDVACWDEINACVVSFVVLWECIKFGGACSSHIHDLAEDVFVFQYIAHKMMWLSTAWNLHIGLKSNLQKVTHHTIWSALCMHTLDAGFMSLSLKMSWWFVLALGTERLHSHLVVPRRSLIIETQLRVSFMRGDEADWQIAQSWAKGCTLGSVIWSESKYPTPYRQ